MENGKWKMENGKWRGEPKCGFLIIEQSQQQAQGRTNQSNKAFLKGNYNPRRDLMYS